MSTSMWVITAISTLGIVGTIAACILVPAVAIPILQSVVRFILGCKFCMAVLAAVALLFAGALYGAHVEKAKCRAQALAAELAAKNIDLKAAKEAEAAANKANAELADQANADRERIADYAEQLKKRPNAACTLTPDDFPDRVRHRSRSR